MHNFIGLFELQPSKKVKLKHTAIIFHILFSVCIDYNYYYYYYFVVVVVNIIIITIIIIILKRKSEYIHTEFAERLARCSCA